MAKKKLRQIIILACSACESQNYTTYINKQNLQKKGEGQPKKLELKKYCKWCKKHTLHKEQKITKAKK